MLHSSCNVYSFINDCCSNTSKPNRLLFFQVCHYQSHKAFNRPFYLLSSFIATVYFGSIFLFSTFGSFLLSCFHQETKVVCTLLLLFFSLEIVTEATWTAMERTLKAARQQLVNSYPRPLCPQPCGSWYQR